MKPLAPVPRIAPITDEDGSGHMTRSFFDWLNALRDRVLGVPIALSSTFAALPTSPSAGMLTTVTDSNTAAWNAVIAGGGANIVLAWFDGTNWRVR